MKKKGKTQKELSEKTEIKPPHISRFFKAKICPRLDTYLIIQNAIMKEWKLYYPQL